MKRLEKWFEKYVSTESLIVFVAVLLVAAIVVNYSDLRAADVVYNANRGTTKRLKDMGDTTHAPVRFIGGVAMLEAAVVHTAAGIAADTFYIIVDLSDTTNYPHGSTTGIDLNQVAVSARQTGDAFNLLLAVVNDIDGSGITFTPVYQAQLPSTLNTVDTSIQYPFGGVDLEVSGTTVAGLFSADVNIPSVTISTDLDSPAGTVNAAVGDLFLFVDETTDGSTLNWAMLVFYGSH